MSRRDYANFSHMSLLECCCNSMIYMYGFCVKKRYTPAVQAKNNLIRFCFILDREFGIPICFHSQPNHLDPLLLMPGK